MVAKETVIVAADPLRAEKAALQQCADEMRQVETRRRASNFFAWLTAGFWTAFTAGALTGMLAAASRVKKHALSQRNASLYLDIKRPEEFPGHIVGIFGVNLKALGHNLLYILTGIGTFDPGAHHEKQLSGRIQDSLEDIRSANGEQGMRRYMGSIAVISVVIGAWHLLHRRLRNKQLAEAEKNALGREMMELVTKTPALATEPALQEAAAHWDNSRVSHFHRSQQRSRQERKTTSENVVIIP